MVVESGLDCIGSISESLPVGFRPVLGIMPNPDIRIWTIIAVTIKHDICNFYLKLSSSSSNDKSSKRLGV